MQFQPEWDSPMAFETDNRMGKLLAIYPSPQQGG